MVHIIMNLNKKDKQKKGSQTAQDRYENFAGFENLPFNEKNQNMYREKWNTEIFQIGHRNYEHMKMKLIPLGQV